MKVTVERLTPWSLALDLARNTMGKDEHGKEPSSEWKRKMLLARHSPIQAVFYRIKMDGIPYWVSVHLVRHKVGVDHFVRSQRSDRTGVCRDDLPQGAPREAWEAVVEALRAAGEVELADACQPECVVCGGYCPELKSCGRAPRRAFS